MKLSKPSEATEICSLRAYELGRQSWLDGAPFCPWPGDNAADRELMFWAGYHRERIRDYWMRRKMALYPESVEPRPMAVMPGKPN